MILSEYILLVILSTISGIFIATCIIRFVLIIIYIRIKYKTWVWK